MIRMLGAVCLAAGPVWLGMSAAAELAHRERALGVTAGAFLVILLL